MDKRVLFVSEKQTFLIKTMVKSLNEAGYEVVIAEPDVVEIDLIKNLPDIYLVYLEGDAKLFSDTLKYLKGKIAEGETSRLLYLIGNENEIGTALESVSRTFIATSFVRPVNMKEIINALDDVVLHGFSRKKRILVVDDDPLLLRTMKNWLSADYDVYMANSGMNAISFLAQNNVDLILLDYEMPVASGLQVFEMIRSEKATAHIPVIFLTAKDDKETVIKVLSAKPEKYLLKTMAPEALVKSVHDFFSGN